MCNGRINCDCPPAIKRRRTDEGEELPEEDPDMIESIMNRDDSSVSSDSDNSSNYNYAPFNETLSDSDIRRIYGIPPTPGTPDTDALPGTPSTPSPPRSPIAPPRNFGNQSHISPAVEGGSRSGQASASNVGSRSHSSTAVFEGGSYCVQDCASNVGNISHSAAAAGLAGGDGFTCTESATAVEEGEGGSNSGQRANFDAPNDSEHGSPVGGSPLGGSPVGEVEAMDHDGEGSSSDERDLVLNDHEERRIVRNIAASEEEVAELRARELTLIRRNTKLRIEVDKLKYRNRYACRKLRDVRRQLRVAQRRILGAEDPDYVFAMASIN